jgi:lipopolysaccharide/colanic/teichoic acid biosynthesis glycosyltransferase
VHKTIDTFFVSKEQNKKNCKLAFKANRVTSSFFKRFLDIFFSVFFLLFIFSWLYPLIAIAIKLDSRGLALFVQERVGLNGKIFKCYKFRTLKTGGTTLDKDSLFNSEYIPVTKVGGFLRKYNLDELPQFINVLVGNMSIVGPRPHAIPFHNLYAEYIEEINLRLLVKPGITGLAQIKGYRGDVRNEEENKRRTQLRVDYDIQYIKNWNIKLDVWIIYITIAQMFGRKK